MIKKTKKRGPGKISKDMREIMYLSFERAGGVEYLVKQSAENPKAYLSMLARLVPNQVALDVKVALDLGQAMIENQANLDRMKVISPVIENEVGTEPDLPKIPKPKPLKSNDNKTNLP